MIPRVLHQTSRRLSPEERRLGTRLRGYHPGWEHRVWSDDENEQLVARSFPEYLQKFRSIQRGVVKADVARYMYLSIYGGFYFDTDYRVLRTISDETLSHSCVLPLSRDTGALFRIGNAVLGSEPGYPFWKDFLDNIFSEVSLGELSEDRIEKTTGPEGLTNFFLERRDLYKGIYLAPKEMFHPPITLAGFSFERHPTTVGAHLCWGSWRTKNLFGMIRRLAVRKFTSF